MSSARPLEKPNVAADILAWTLEGNSTRQVAARLTQKNIHVSYQAVGGFLRRHRPELEAMQARVVEAVEQHLITDLDERIHRLSVLYDDVDAWQEENGISEITVGYDKDGAERSRTVRLNGILVNAKRAILHDVAEQLGQLPKDGASATALAQAVVIVRGGPETGV